MRHGVPAVLPGELGGTVEMYNVPSTIGVGVLTVSATIFLVNLIRSLRHGQAAGNDPWDARTLEWLSPSPTPTVNFWRIPEVYERDEFWERKYALTEDERAVPIPAGGSDDHADSDVGYHDEHGYHDPDGNHIHMPHPSYWPLIFCLGFFPLGYGIIFRSTVLIALAGVVMLVSFFGWIIEPVAEGDDDYEPDLTPANS